MTKHLVNKIWVGIDKVCPGVLSGLQWGFYQGRVRVRVEVVFKIRERSNQDESMWGGLSRASHTDSWDIWGWG